MSPDTNIIPPAANNIIGGIAAPAALPVEPLEEDLREFGDVPRTRKAIYDNVFNAVAGLEPVSNTTHTLRVVNPQYVDADKFTKKQRKEAQLSGQTLARRLRATWELLDNATDQVVDSRQQVIMRVPHLTDSGTFVHNGNEYALVNQQRLRAGIYARLKESGEIEAHSNIIKGGPSHRYFLDPAKGIFYARFGQAKVPLLPLLSAMGAEEKELRDAWGADIYANNYSKKDGGALRKLVERLLSPKELEAAEGNVNTALRTRMERMELDPDTAEHTLGQRYDRVTKDAILAATVKLLKINRGEVETDDRDQLAYQTFHGPEDLFAERIARDRAGVRRQLLFKASGKGNLQSMPSSALQKQLESALLETGLGRQAEEINPLEIYDKNTQISRLGEGAIPSLDSIPEESRDVQASQFGFIDGIRTPESMKAGVDVYLAANTRKGKDGQLYTKLTDNRSGKSVWRTPQQLKSATLSFPGGMKSKRARVPVIREGKLLYARKQDIDYELDDFEQAFSPMSNLVPIKSGMKGQRMAMAARMLTQALPLSQPEAPLVQTGVRGTNGMESYEDRFGVQAGAIRAERPGKVVAIDGENVHVQYDDGTRDTIELYQNHPYSRKTAIHQTATIQPGQRFQAGSLLARSNYTDDQGTTALGVNARTAFIPWKGLNYEDAIVISEGMAKRLTSDHMYRHELDKSDRTTIDKKSYIQQFPGKLSKAMLAKYDANGAIKPGTEVKFGDPLILAIEQRSRALNKLHKKRQAGYTDQSVTWEHHDPGVVTDVYQSKNGPAVLVKSSQEMQIGDKLSNRFGGKGVISGIIPDAQMPHNKGGQPYEVLLNPLGVISRTNPAQIHEAVLGKLARKLGRPIKFEDFGDIEDNNQWVEDMLKKHGMSATEDLIDPEHETTIPGILTGEKFFMKLQHQAEGKGQGRGGGGYAADGTPARGGAAGSKKMSMLDVNALLSHGAIETIRDAGNVRGQQNDQYWLQFMQGHTPTSVKVPQVYEKFVDQLKGAGINVIKDGPRTHIMALTNQDVKTLAKNRFITSGETVRFDQDLKPIKGGLFDPTLTGGHSGQHWSAIKLQEPMPNPVMEDPIRRMLNLTQQGFRDVLSGAEQLGAHGTGPTAIGKALDAIHVDREMILARGQIHGSNKGERDKAIRRLGYLKSAKRLNLHPRDWMLDAVPVIPPRFRPVSTMGNKNLPLVSDANYLYKELLDANDNLTEMTKRVGQAGVIEERLAVYDAFKGVTGLGDPITVKNQDRDVKGLLKGIFGSSPKYGTVQRKLLGTTVDNVGRSVITPNPDFDMDTIGIPEDKAYDVYQRFIVRRLRRKGMPMIQAMQQVKDKTSLAKAMLLEEMETRPVISNRAPVLHRFGIMAFRPKLVKGSVLQLSPLVTSGFNADFDGDQQIGKVFACIDNSKIKSIVEIVNFTVESLSAHVMPLFNFALPVASSDNTVYVFDLEDFPHGCHEKTTRGQFGEIDWFQVPEGVRVLSHGIDGSLTWQQVSYWSKHRGCPVVMVNLKSGRQIITDDDPRAVYGIAAGSLKAKRFTPGEAAQQKVFVPRVVGIGEETLEHSKTSLDITPYFSDRSKLPMLSKLELTADFGYLIGVAAGDGWSAANGCDFCLASINQPIVDKVDRAIKNMFLDEHPTYCRTVMTTSYGNSIRYVWSSIELSALIADLVGRGSRQKCLPPWFMATPLEFRLGLFAGVMDTDGSISISHGKSKPQLMANVSSTSLRLLREVSLLAMTLGIRGRITPGKTPAGADCWIWSPSNMDIKCWNADHMVHTDKLKAINSIELKPTPAGIRHDIVPISYDLIKAVNVVIRKPKDRSKWAVGLPSVYTALRLATKTGALTRHTSERLLEYLPDGKLDHPDWAPWQRLVQNRRVTWDAVESIEETDRVETGFDLTVPGTETFMAADGVVLSNTMNWHVPVTEEASREALDRMLPSRQLLSPADFNSPLNQPGQEYLGGLAQASGVHGNSDRPIRTFRNRKDAILAYRQGKIGINDRVKILEP